MLLLSFLKHLRKSGKLVTFGPFRGLATRHAGIFLAGFGGLLHSQEKRNDFLGGKCDGLRLVTYLFEFQLPSSSALAVQAES